jgi:ABC-type proline/glycine betaine transport system permease subunit
VESVPNPRSPAPLSAKNRTSVSLLRAAAGFTIGGTIGFAFGTAVGFSRIADAVFDRSIQMIRAIPFLALLPLVIVWFGVGEAEKILLVSLGVSFPIYINTTLGIRQVDPKLVELGRVMGLSRRQLVRRIILPGALPSVLTGVRYSLATACINSTVQAAIGGTAAGNVYEYGSDRNFPIVVRLAPKYRQSLDAIRHITIGATNPSGSGVVPIPLTDVAKVNLVSGPSFIYRENQERYIPVKFSVRGRDLGDAVLERSARWPSRSRCPLALGWNGSASSAICRRR